MDRKAWLVLIIAILGIVGLEIYNTQVYRIPQARLVQEEAMRAAETKRIAEEEAARNPAPTLDLTSTPSATPEATPTPTPAPEPEFALPERTIELRNEFLTLTLTSRGAGIAAVRLPTHLGEKDEKVILSRDSRLPIGAVSEEPNPEQLPNFELVSSDNASATFRGEFSPGIMLERTIRLPKLESRRDEYRVEITNKFTNNGSQQYRSDTLFFHAGSAAPIHENDLPMNTALDFYVNGKTRQIDVNWFESSRIPLVGIQLRGARPVFEESGDKIAWLGTKSQFFTTILLPRTGTGTDIWGQQIRLPTDNPDARPWLGIEGALGMPGIKLGPGETTEMAFDVYSGPKEFERLKELGDRAEEIMRLGWFKPISLFLLWSMNSLGALFHNYAVAIIVLTLLIKTALWPVQNKAMESMRKMSVLGPKMTELRERNKDNPAAANQEMMKLYKDYGVNPFGSCLPMLLQIPIFFGFYSMLGSAVELRNTGFLWVSDLSQPDTVFHLVGFPINILPIVMAVTMVWQMHITPKAGDPAQQKILMLMPIMFLVFCYNYASALALYWTTQNIFSIVQLYMTRNKPLPTLTKVKPPEPLPAMGAKPKKKKKPRLRP